MQTLVGLVGLVVIVAAAWLGLQAGGVVTQAVVLILTAAVTYSFTRLQEREKYERELDQKLVSDKRLLYKAFLDVTKKMTTKGEAMQQADFTARIRTFAFSSMMNASEDVILAYNEFTKLSVNPETREQTLPALGEVILAMRRDIGFEDGRLTTPDIMRSVISDLDENIEVFNRWERAHSGNRHRASSDRRTRDPL